MLSLSPETRVKRSFAQDVPSPAVFFRPLYSVHNGNFQTWTGAPRTSWQLSQDCVNTLQGTSGSSVWEVTTLLMDSQKQPWQSVGLQREEGSGIGLRGAPSSEEALPAECVGWRAWPPVYLPQEDWAPGLPTGLVAPESGGGSEYCAVGCSGDCCPTVLAEDTQSSEPVAAEACSLSWDPQGLDPQPGLLCESRLE